MNIILSDFLFRFFSVDKVERNLIFYEAFLSHLFQCFLCRGSLSCGWEASRSNCAAGFTMYYGGFPLCSVCMYKLTRDLNGMDRRVVSSFLQHAE